MLRDELLTKMKESQTRCSTLTGDELVKEKAQFDELADEIKRIDVIAEREARTVHNREVNDAQLWNVWGKLMRGEQVDQVGRDALALRDTSMVDSNAAGGFRIPGDGRVWLQRSTTTTTTEAPPLGHKSSDIADLIPCPPLGPLFQLPLPPTPIFDRATKLGALNGVAIPFIDQTIADPFAGVTVSRPVPEGSDKPESDIPANDQLEITTIEYAGSTVISDLALRRAPNYEAVIAHFMRGALAFKVEADIVTAMIADANIVDVPRAVALQVAWSDLIDLEGAIPWYWAISGEYALDQTVQTYLKRTLTAAPGYPMYTSTTANAMYTALNGRPYFLDDLSALGTTGDVFYGDFRNIFVGVGSDIVFKRTSEGLQLTQANSTLFAVFAHIGIGIPVGETFSRLDDVVTTTT